MIDITQELEVWLTERKAQINLFFAGPKGGSVPINTWTPDGFTAQLQVVAPVTEEKSPNASTNTPQPE